MTRRLVVPSLLVGLALLAGCARVPTQEIEAAEKAMEDARTAEAPTYAVEAWTATEDTHARLETELQTQEQAFFLSRSYAEAKKLAAQTEEQAKRAAADAIAGKETARNDSRKVIDEAKALHAEVQKMLETAPTGKGTKADLAALKADTGSTEEFLVEAENAYQNGNYLEAQSKAQSAIQALNRVKSEIEAAHQARGSRA